MEERLQKEYGLDVWKDLLLVRNDRLILFTDLNKAEDMEMEVVVGSLSLLGFEDEPSMPLSTLLSHFDEENAYAEVGGKKEHFHDVYTQIHDFPKEPIVTFPIVNDSGRYWLRFHLVLLPEKEDLAAIFLTDVTKNLLAEEDIFIKSHKDSLTGLFNKYTLDYHYGRRYNRDDFHALYLDIDDFKDLNDEKGHRVGDDYLRAFSKILRAHECDYNRFYRIGGDEFIGLFFEDEKTVLDMARDILEKTRAMSKKLFETETTVSIGIVQADERDDVLRKADQLMYEAKESGKDRYLFKKESAL